MHSILLNFWERIKMVKHFDLQAKSHAKTGWNGKGQGHVLVTQENSNTLVFQERGSWEMAHDPNMAFTNVFRWTLDEPFGISLEHLRLGPNAPVFLFHLVPIESNILASADPHLCGEDAYLAKIIWDQNSIRLSWRVLGPRKNEEMEYHYL